MKFPIILLLICFPLFVIAQQQRTVSGLLYDEDSKEPIPYATVMLKAGVEDRLITGSTTDENGAFSLKASEDSLTLHISFIGYKAKEVSISSNQAVVNLGRIGISRDAQSLAEVEVVQERSQVEFKLDKRVFNVGKDISSTGMGAMEVLQNVPSVNVDIEGNITLRGNSGVQILINGKPSVLSDEGSNALGSITADMIESVEVITNPSAKYEAGGTSGILNIVLKKEEKKGLNGSVSFNTGWPHNHSVGLSLNRRTEKFNLFTQMGAGYRSIPSYEENLNIQKSTNERVASEGVEYRNENFYNITLGSDYYINPYNTLTLSGNFALELEQQPSEIDFESFIPGAASENKWRREEETEAINPKYQYDLQYEKQFKNNEDHKLLFSTLGSFFGKTLESNFTNTTLQGQDRDARQRTETSFYQANYTTKIDYTNPISEVFTLESGAQFDINDVGNEFTVSNFENGGFVADSALTNDFTFIQRVYGAYSTAAYEKNRWGLKLGLRMEYTLLNTVLETTGEKNRQEYKNLFPSVHSSYKFSDFISVQAGYSRRIFRPRLWDLNPFFNIRNNFNIRRGNPELEPEFADSYELTAVFVTPKASFNTSLYHLFTTNVVERITQVENNVNITEPSNIGTNSKIGFELNGKYTPFDFYTLNGDFNYGVFNRKGSFNNQVFDFRGDQWSTRLNNKFKISKELDLELTGSYQSKVKTVQGTRSGYATMDLGIRNKFWNGKGVLNLSIRDVFASRIRESIVDQDNFYSYAYARRGRFITLGFSYSIGKGEAMTYSGRMR